MKNFVLPAEKLFRFFRGNLPMFVNVAVEHIPILVRGNISVNLFVDLIGQLESVVKHPVKVEYDVFHKSF